MSEEDLIESLAKEAEKVMKANDYLEAKLIADREVELDTDEEAVLTKKQKADLEKTTVN